MTITAKLRPFVVPLSLLLLSFIPSLFGFVRIFDLVANGRTEENSRFYDSLGPVLLHCFFGALFFVLGSFQFGHAFRRKFPKWHRAAGTIALPSGALMAFTGIWMTVALGAKPGEDILYVTRLVVGALLFGFVVVSVWALLRKKFATHGAFAARAFALGAGAGTQAALFLPFIALGGEATPPAIVVVHLAAWTINIVYVEWIIRRRRRDRSHMPTSQSPLGFSHPVSPSN